MDIIELQNLLRRYGLKPNFTYGQNFLVDDLVLQNIVDAAAISAADNVLEIGPGVGNLTRLLCGRAKLVLSIEKDPAMLPILKSLKKDYKNFRYEVADALVYDFPKFFAGQEYKVVANIPYYVTGKILQMLMTAEHKPTSVVVLTQKEVAQNVCAKAGDLSILAISVQLYGEPELIRVVSAKSFYPVPKVDSAILKIDVHKRAEFNIADEKKFFGVLRACFAGKRKQIHNTLKNNLHLDQNSVGRILEAAKIKPEARPQELSIPQWIKLIEKIQG
ncbi:MAG: ribosomal RNA small subunit methyltransferase A [Patescibacteria group bacterium]|nr:ribosomal RNA small subunit methyltransferase A [Patescibacteria group bacterium]